MAKKHDRDGFLLLLIIVVACIALYPYIDDIIGRLGFSGNNDDGYGTGKPSDITTLLKEKRKAERSRVASQYYAVPHEEIKLFPFDPNTADSSQLLSLGLQPWQVRNIYRYRAKGGRYRQPSDFARLYGLTAEHYRRLLPYIKIKQEPMAADVYGTPSSYTSQTSKAYDGIANQSNPSASQHERGQIRPDTVLFPRKLRLGEVVNINKADTSSLKKIPGIGSYYSKKIVYLRQQLGGFYDPRQLLVIDNFPETALSYMSVGTMVSGGRPQGVLAIKINRQDARTLSRHPYIKYVQAKHIVELRQHHGSILSVDDLYRIPSFSPEEIQRLAPYLDFE